MCPWGNKTQNCKLAHFSGCGPNTAAVGVLIDGQSPFGLNDMAGNVWEFVSDMDDKNDYKNSPPKDPKGPSSNVDPNSVDRVLRGGCFECTTDMLRTSARKATKCPYLSADAGIRCCRAL